MWGDCMERLANFFLEQLPKKILDVGTGAGNFIELIRQLYSDYEEIIGIDTLEYAITSARKTFVTDEKVHFLVMDAIHMDFPDDSFDMVCLSNSLHHLTVLEPIFKEMKRVVKPGGYIVVSEMVSNDLDNRQMAHLKMHHFAAEIDRYLGDTHNDTFTDEEIIQRLQEHSGCEIVESWPLLYERRTENSDDEIEWLIRTVDRVINRVVDPMVKQEFLNKGNEIKDYIKTHGFDSATTLIVVMKK